MFAYSSSSPAVAFSPAQNHEIELSVALINQVPRVPAREHDRLNQQRQMVHCVARQPKKFQSHTEEDF